MNLIKRHWKRLLLTLSGVAALLLLISLPWWSARLTHDHHAIFRDTLPQFESADFSGELSILTYNIAHGRGPAVGTENDTPGTEVQRAERLEAIGRAFLEEKIDFIILNEVDFDTYWNQRIHQARTLAEYGGYRHIAWQENYDVRFPFSHLQFGNALLSRYPILSTDHIIFTPLSHLEDFTAGNHDGLKVRLQLSEDLEIEIWVVHLDSRDEDTRVLAARKLREMLTETEVPVILAGDMNSTPEGWPNKEYPSQRGPNALDILITEPYWHAFPDSPEDGHTFPSMDPIRTIDWIFYPSDWELIHGEIPDWTWSDHSAVRVDLRVD